MFLNKKDRYKEDELEKILIDIKRIVYVNPNAALSQIRTFIECYTNAVLRCEGKDIEGDLVNKINMIRNYDLLNDDEIEMLHQIRRIGNQAVHKYYCSSEEASAYLEICNEIYNKFLEKYDAVEFQYKKNILKRYFGNKKIDKKDKKEVENKKSNYNGNLLDKKEVENKKSNYNGNLLQIGEVVVPDEEITINKLESYEKIKKRILDSEKDIKNIIKDLDLKEDRVDGVFNKLKENRFNLVILGEFNRGKSTFINALLGKVVLPSNILPTTSVITRLNYSEEIKIVVTMDDNSKKEIGIDNLVEYVTENNSSDDVKIVDIYYPIDICKYGCVIVDTPGVNDLNEQNVIITEKYIPQADAVLFMLDSDQVFSESEKIFIKNKVMKSDIKKIFFIVNKADNIKEKTFNSLKKYVNDTVEELNLKSKIYYISSKKVLINKINSNCIERDFEEDKYFELFNEFLHDLEVFLIEEKGRYILTNSSNRLKNIVDSIIKNIFIIEEDMIKDVNVLQNEYDKFLIISKKIESKKNDIVTEINREYIKFKNDVKEIIYKELDSSFDNLLNDIYRQSEFSEDILKNLESNINKKIKFKNDVKEIIYKELDSSFDNLLNDIYRQSEFSEDILKNLESNINKKINIWIEQRVNPFIITKMEIINNKLLNLIRDSIKSIDEIGNIDKLNIVNEKISESNALIVQTSKIELQTCYINDSVESDENVFIGAGALISFMMTGSILSESNALIVQTSKIELQTCYINDSVESDENVFIGAGALISFMMTGSILSGVGGALLGLFAHEYIKNKNNNNVAPREKILSKVEKKKNNVIREITENIESTIDKSYNLNIKYVDKYINNYIENTNRRINNILKEKEKKNHDLNIIIKKLNSMLKKLYIINKQNDMIINSLEEK